MKKRVVLRKQFREAWNYLRECKRHIFFILFLFIFSAFFGFIYMDKLTFLDELLKDIIYQTSDLNMLEMIFFILQNNVQSAFFGMIFGVFFGIFSLINSLLNGVVIGYVLAKIYPLTGFSEFWRLLPHGIFELPAIFISLGAGLRLGGILFSGDVKKQFKIRIYNSLNLFLMIIIPLLIVVAILEGVLVFLI